MIRHRIVTGLVFTFIFISGFLAYENRYDIYDWWKLRSYEPPQRIEALASQASLNEYGRRLFYVHEPVVQTKSEFNANCDIEDAGLVLGCYNGIGIYILDVTNVQIEKVEQVTAAHEMLHAAYDRLSNAEREEVNGMLAEAYETITDERLLSIIEQYRERDPSILNTELHSIIGTELYDIPQALEQYYSQYFVDRKKIVAEAKAYEKVFLDIEAEIERIEQRLNNLSTQINDIKAELDQLSSEVNAERARLDALLEQDRIEEYNRAVPGFNALVSSYNANVDTAQKLVERYNVQLAEYRDKAFQQSELYNDIDSNFQPI